ncbi:uncharacterized protein G2W53_033757 [Senna tora]|uniref:Uncharacterized protein n=1 Tax=Senna tora TaxID=362788 RepID=A0A834WBA0_9FABA|nr:uncharacterized protein G2W53_033757 [Senna tora]
MVFSPCSRSCVVVVYLQQIFATVASSIFFVTVAILFRLVTFSMKVLRSPFEISFPVKLESSSSFISYFFSYELVEQDSEGQCNFGGVALLLPYSL